VISCPAFAHLKPIPIPSFPVPPKIAIFILSIL